MEKNVTLLLTGRLLCFLWNRSLSHSSYYFTGFLMKFLKFIFGYKHFQEKYIYMKFPIYE